MMPLKEQRHLGYIPVADLRHYGVVCSVHVRNGLPRAVEKVTGSDVSIDRAPASGVGGLRDRSLPVRPSTEYPPIDCIGGTSGVSARGRVLLRSGCRQDPCPNRKMAARENRGCADLRRDPAVSGRIRRVGIFGMAIAA